MSKYLKYYKIWFSAENFSSSLSIHYPFISDFWQKQSFAPNELKMGTKYLCILDTFTPDVEYFKCILCIFQFWGPNRVTSVWYNQEIDKHSVKMKLDFYWTKTKNA